MPVLCRFFMSRCSKLKDTECLVVLCILGSDLRLALSTNQRDTYLKAAWSGRLFHMTYFLAKREIKLSIAAGLARLRPARVVCAQPARQTNDCVRETT